MNVPILLTAANYSGMNSRTSYVIGAIIALLILGYLVFSLIKPEKF
jgi:K+-transporting ATPase KdpF subunit